KPAPVTASSTTSSTATGGFTSTGTDQNLIDSNDPFNVQSGSTTTTASAGTASASTGDASASDENEEQASGGTFSLDLVKNLEITTNTTQGVLKLHFTSDDKGRLKLDGDLGGHKLSLEGDQAGQILSKLMQSMDLSDALTASMNGKVSTLDPNVLNSLQTLHIDMKDGRKIDTNPKGKGPKDAGPKAEGRHDNGKHKGQEKHGK
ncbi:MAG: hypothetical protein ACXVDJ_10970, partial [Tumebacillaceae bacterium]